MSGECQVCNKEFKSKTATLVPPTTVCVTPQCNFPMCDECTKQTLKLPNGHLCPQCKMPWGKRDDPRLQVLSTILAWDVLKTHENELIEFASLMDADAEMRADAEKAVQALRLRGVVALTPCTNVFYRMEGHRAKARAERAERDEFAVNVARFAKNGELPQQPLVAEIKATPDPGFALRMQELGQTIAKDIAQRELGLKRKRLLQATVADLTARENKMKKMAAEDPNEEIRAFAAAMGDRIHLEADQMLKQKQEAEKSDTQLAAKIKQARAQFIIKDNKA